VKLVGYVCPFCGYVSKKVEYVEVRKNKVVFPSMIQKFDYEKYLFFPKCKHITHVYSQYDCQLNVDEKNKILYCKVLAKKFDEKFLYEWKWRRKYKGYKIKSERDEN